MLYAWRTWLRRPGQQEQPEPPATYSGAGLKRELFCFLLILFYFIEKLCFVSVLLGCATMSINLHSWLCMFTACWYKWNSEFNSNSKDGVWGYFLVNLSCCIHFEIPRPIRVVLCFLLQIICSSCISDLHIILCNYHVIYFMIIRKTNFRHKRDISLWVAALYNVWLVIQALIKSLIQSTITR